VIAGRSVTDSTSSTSFCFETLRKTLVWALVSVSKKAARFNAFPVKDGMVLSKRKLTACVGSWPDLALIADPVTSLSYLILPQLAAWSQRVCRHVVGVECWNPAFDVTPAQLITGGIVTEFGVHQPHELKDALTAALTWCQSTRRHGDTSPWRPEHYHQGPLGDFITFDLACRWAFRWAIVRSKSRLKSKSKVISLRPNLRS